MRRIWLGLVCFLVGVIVVPLAVFFYLKFGGPPVAVTDPAFPFEKQIVHMPLKARIAREMPASSPVEVTPEALVAGASIYAQHCAFCHGLPGKPSNEGRHMYPHAPQLWQSHRAGVVGVSDDPVGATYWRVKNGIRLTGMPAYADLLSEDQMWQVSLLLANAAKPLPPQAQTELSH